MTTQELIVRLRGQAYTQSRPDQLNVEAAETIEQLQAEVERLTRKLSDADVLLEECKMDWLLRFIQH